MSPKTPKKKKVAPDRLPGEFHQRVFIGGNYDNMKLLRDIRKVVRKLGLIPILPRDDVDVPLHDVHDWDLRILHTCRYAIFDVSIPAGELMEIERIRDYGTQALLLYQSREEGPPDHISRMVRTSKLSLKGYLTDEDLRKTIREFFFPTEPLDRAVELYLQLIGYCFSKSSSSETIKKDGFATEITRWEGLKAKGDKPVTIIDPHEFDVSSGEILSINFRVIKGDSKRIKWVPTRKESKKVEGKVEIDPPLTKDDPDVSYEFTVKTKGAYCLTKDEFRERYPEERDIVEWFGMQIHHPVSQLEMRVKFYNGYPFNPQIAIFYGAYRDVDAITEPMVSFFMPNSTEAVLDVTWPKPIHGYRILWEPADKA